MIETGFTIVNNYQEWKKLDSNSYNFVYNFEQSVATCSVSIHKLGPVTVITGLFYHFLDLNVGLIKVMSTHLSFAGNYNGDPIKESFVMTKTRITDIVKSDSSLSINQRFYDLKEISCEFKNKIALALRSRMSRMDTLNPYHIHSLPDEVLVQIAENLSDATTIKGFMETSPRFRNVTKHPLLWKRLLER